MEKYCEIGLLKRIAYSFHSFMKKILFSLRTSAAFLASKYKCWTQPLHPTLIALKNPKICHVSDTFPRLSISVSFAQLVTFQRFFWATRSFDSYDTIGWYSSILFQIHPDSLSGCIPSQMLSFPLKQSAFEKEGREDQSV